MPESAEHAVLGFRGQAIKQVCPRLIRLGQRQRAIAGSADVISRNHCPSPTRVMFNPPSALPALTFEASHAAGSGSVRSVTPLSLRADATLVDRACVIVLTLLPYQCVSRNNGRRSDTVRFAVEDCEGAQLELPGSLLVCADEVIE
jgi:hypothetical protein